MLHFGACLAGFPVAAEYQAGVAIDHGDGSACVWLVRVSDRGCGVAWRARRPRNSHVQLVWTALLAQLESMECSCGWSWRSCSCAELVRIAGAIQCYGVGYGTSGRAVVKVGLGVQ